MNKIEKFTDNYVLFINCGVRGWGIYTVVTLISFAIIIANPQYESWVAVLMFLGMITMFGVWYRDYAIRYIPKFWVELGKGKNYQD